MIYTLLHVVLLRKKCFQINIRIHFCAGLPLKFTAKNILKKTTINDIRPHMNTQLTIKNSIQKQIIQ